MRYFLVLPFLMALPVLLAEPPQGSISPAEDTLRLTLEEEGVVFHRVLMLGSQHAHEDYVAGRISYEQYVQSLPLEGSHVQHERAAGSGDTLVFSKWIGSHLANYTLAQYFKVTNTTNIDRLFFWVYNYNYDLKHTGVDKGSVRINGGAWKGLNNYNATCHRADAEDGGIAGTSETVRCAIPTSGWTINSGLNTVEWRFNVTDGWSSGYYILYANLLPSTYTGQLSLSGVRANGRISSTIIRVNPATYTYPAGFTSGADINAGKNLWENANLTDPPGPGGGSRMARVAKCKDCHARDGSDLKYFGYSNKTITSRAMFHGLTMVQGLQIAAYIRSLPTITAGTPWDPPYQPGPYRALPTM